MTLSDIIKEFNDADDFLATCRKNIDTCISLIEHYRNTIESQLFSLAFNTGTSSNEAFDSFSKLLETTKNSYLDVLKELVRPAGAISFELGSLSLALRASDSAPLFNELYNLTLRSEHINESLSCLIGNALCNKVDFKEFLKLQNTFYSCNYKCVILQKQALLLNDVKEKLLEPLPKDVSVQKLVSFELQSYKATLDFSTYVQDLTYLSKFMTQIQRILNPESPIFVRRIESGSLNIIWSGNKIEIEAISDIINAIVNGIQTLCFMPVNYKIKKEELQTLKLQNRSLEIDIQSKTLAVINSQIDILTDRLNLKKDNPEHIEIIQAACAPLVEYLENNPAGCINHKEYNIHSSIKNLVKKGEDQQ